MNKYQRGKRLKLRQEKWENDTVKEALKGAPERQAEFATRRERIPVKRVYTPLDLEEVGFDYPQDLGFPGEYPYTRGISPTMYRSRLWVMSQVSGFGSSEQASKRWRYLLDKGASGFLIEFDLPTQMGLDSDHPLSQSEVARLGVAIDSLDDLERALDLPFEKIREIYVIASSISPIILAMFIVMLEKRKISPASFTLIIQNEILKEFTCRGMYIFPPWPSIRIATDVIEYCVKNYPNWVPLSICGSHMAGSGATPAQETGFALSNAITYLEEAVKRGLNVDDIAPSLSYLTSAHMDFFEEIAKLRALRKIWARLMKERFGAKDPHSMMLRYVLVAGGISLTAQQPLNNIARLAITNLACALAGGQQIGLSCYDEGVAIPTEDAVRVSAAIQHIVAEETGIVNTADPLGGSYYLECLTKEIEKRVLEIIEKVDEMGGAVSAIGKGFPQRELAAEAYRWQKDIEEGKVGIVGVNRLQIEEETAPETFRVDPGVEKRQIERLQRLKRERDYGKVRKALQEVKEAARGEDNLLPPMIEAVKVYATVGEICDTLKEVFGKYEEDVTRAI